MALRVNSVGVQYHLYPNTNKKNNNSQNNSINTSKLNSKNLQNSKTLDVLDILGRVSISFKSRNIDDILVTEEDDSKVILHDDGTKTILKYNPASQNETTTCIYYNKNGEMRECRYNKADKPTYVNGRDAKGQILYEDRYQYDVNNAMVKYISNDRKNGIKEYTYDPNTGKCTKSVWFCKNGTKEICLYNPQTERLERITYYNEDGSVLHSIVCNGYDENGKPIIEFIEEE